MCARAPGPGLLTPGAFLCTGDFPVGQLDGWGAPWCFLFVCRKGIVYCMTPICAQHLRCLYRIHCGPAKGAGCIVGELLYLAECVGMSWVSLCRALWCFGLQIRGARRRIGCLHCIWWSWGCVCALFHSAVMVHIHVCGLCAVLWLESWVALCSLSL